MRKLISLLLLLSCWNSTVIAQDNTTDSLRHLLSVSREDTSKVLLLALISRTFLFSNSDSSLLLAQQGVILSRKINFRNGEIYCLRQSGNVFFGAGNYPRALEIYLQALKIAEETNNELQKGLSLANLANVYLYEGDIKRSIYYSHQSIFISRKLKDSLALGNVLINIGDTYEKANQLDSALYYTRLGYSIALSENSLARIGICFNNLGNIFLKQGKLDSALTAYRSALSKYAIINDQNGNAEVFLGMAKIFLKRQITDSGVYYAKRAFHIANTNGFTDQILSSSIFLTDFYRNEGNVDSAYTYMAATIAAKDSLFSQQKANQLQSITYDESVRQQQIEEVKEQQAARLKEGILIVGLAALLVVAVLLLRNNGQKRKANRLLQQQKEEINNKARELVTQKENLQQSHDNVEQMGEIGRKITASLSVEKIIGTVYDNVNTLMDASVFGIGMYNDSSKTIDFPATYEEGKQLPFYSNSVEDLNRFAVICLKQGKEIIIGNLNEEHKLYIQEVMTPQEGKLPVSLIYLPLEVKQKILGVITVQSFQFNAYSDYQLFMLRNIAIYTAIALENAKAFEELNQAVVNLKTTQSQLIQSEKMASLGELTAGIAHEIQNPLNFVNNFSEVNAELIAELKQELDMGNMEDVRSLAGNIEENERKILHHGRRADAIVKGMLLHSQASIGRKEPTDIHALADEYLRLAYHGIRAKDKSFNADYTVDFDKTLGKVNIVSQDIGRVLLNMYTNAFYAVHEKAGMQKNGYKPSVGVSTKKHGEALQITIRDNGNGISQKVMDKIFQPFFTTKPAGKGTGLGLSLSYDIVKAHGGEIKVYSKEGEWTEFIVELP